MIQLPLNGGLVLQADPEDFGANACTVLSNVAFDSIGKISKIERRGDAVSISASVVALMQWVAPNGTTYWVAGISDGKIYVTTDLTSLGSVVFDGSNTFTRIYNYGSMLRFANGTGELPKVYQYIDRDFFWGGYSPAGAFSIDTNKPIDIDFTVEHLGESEMSALVTSGASHTSKNYAYKMTFVYDGNQETPLPDKSFANNKIAIGDLTAPNADDDCLGFVLQFAESDWNSRCTGLNIYRSTDAGSYYKISSISAKSKTSDGNIKRVTDAEILSTTRGYFHSMVGYDGESKPLEENDYVFINEGGGSTQTGKFTSLGQATSVTSGNGGTLASLSIGGTHYEETVYASEYAVEGFESGTGGWVASGAGASVSSSSTREFRGSNSLKCYVNSDNGQTFTKTYTIPEGESIYGVCLFVLYLTTSTTFTLTYSVNGGSSWVSMSSGSSQTGVDGQTWSRKLVLDPTIGTDNLMIRLTASSSSTTARAVYIDEVAVLSKLGKISTGANSTDNTVIYSSSFDLSTTDDKIGQHIQAGTSSSNAHEATVQYVKNNNRGIIRLKGAGHSSGTNKEVLLSPRYSWKDLVSSANHQLTFTDQGDTDGVTHPYGKTSINVNYTYSQFLDGRNYVAGVALNPSTDNEIHNDWVIFSELNQPDVIPISNYIQIKDLQGGEITGLAKLMGDLVVFQNKGIYRLSIPSADPASWSLSESEPNIGCVASESIETWENGLFFAGDEAIYYLNPNFQATPITNTIRDYYEAKGGKSSTKIKVDTKKAQLVVKMANMTDKMFILDLNLLRDGTEHWTQHDLEAGQKTVTYLVKDTESDLYTLEQGSTSYLLKLYNSSSTETRIFKRTTGWIPIGDLDKAGVLRRLNFRYNSTDIITVKIYTDGDSSTVVNTYTIPADTSGADWYKTKPAVRCRYFMIEVSTSASANDVEIRRMEADFG